MKMWWSSIFCKSCDISENTPTLIGKIEANFYKITSCFNFSLDRKFSMGDYWLFDEKLDILNVYMSSNFKQVTFMTSDRAEF